MNVLFGKGLVTKYILTLLTSLSMDKCVDECASRPKCALVRYERLSNFCELHTEEALQNENIVQQPGSIVVMDIDQNVQTREKWVTAGHGNLFSINSTLIVKPVFQNKTERIKCLSNGSWEFVTPVRYCPGRRDCTDAQNLGNTIDGIYYVNMTYSFDCSFDDERNAWLNFQRRKDGSVDFNRNWYNYTTGFGFFDGEFWLGLETLYQITRTGLYTLRVDMETFDGTWYYAQYSMFNLTGAIDNYRLLASGYEGDAGNSLAYHSGMSFTTFDRDNDIAPDNCATQFSGGGWFNCCHQVHLNGLYFPSGGTTSTYADHIHWHSITGYDYSLKSTEMRIRRNV